MSGVFARVLCCDDGSQAARRTTQLAAAMVEPGGVVEVVAMPERGAAAPAAPLLAQIRRREPTLAAFRAPRQSRAVGIALGSVPTFLLHEAPCSVLVARDRPLRTPGRIVVGLDGSPESALALAAAQELAERLGRSLTPVVATQEAHAELDAARRLHPGVEEWQESAVDLLAHLSEDAELVVVGNRRLKGVRSLGSVSERVAHDARCPVLVVRGPAHRLERTARPASRAALCAA